MEMNGILWMVNICKYPVPVDRRFIPLFLAFCLPSKVVLDLHPQNAKADWIVESAQEVRGLSSLIYTFQVGCSLQFPKKRKLAFQYVSMCLQTSKLLLKRKHVPNHQPDFPMFISTNWKAQPRRRKTGRLARKCPVYILQAR